MKNSKTIYDISVCSLFTALITVFTAYLLHFPVGGNGGYIHIGDAFIYISACLLPFPYAPLSAAVGSGLADILTAPLWAPATVIIKLAVSFMFTSKQSKIVNTRNVSALLFSAAIIISGYFFAEYILFKSWAACVTMLIPNLIQVTASSLLFLLFGISLDKADFKNRFFKGR